MMLLCLGQASPMPEPNLKSELSVKKKGKRAFYF